MFTLIHDLFVAVVHAMVVGNGPRIVRRKIDRHRRYTAVDHGRFPAGSACWVSRARAASFVVLEMDDGSVIELGPGGYVASLELIDDRIQLLDLVAFLTELNASRSTE